MLGHDPARATLEWRARIGIVLFILYPQIFACIERVPFALGGWRR